LKSLEVGKVKKKIRQEYDEDMTRLEKSQAKYVHNPKKIPTTISKAENKKWEQKAKDRYTKRVWKGWRDSDSKASPVTVYKLSDLNKEKPL
jgi:mRNA-degrading endonuclease YafQ of YafQ-DinJ toxin-antitoxin module